MVPDDHIHASFFILGHLGVTQLAGGLPAAPPGRLGGPFEWEG